jgi:hypothetical protein
MGEFSPITRNGDCEEIANLSTAYGRRRRNWIDAHSAVPARQVVDASCGNKHCIALRHSYLRPRVEQPGKYPKIAKRVHRLKIGQHFDVRASVRTRGAATISLRVVCGCAVRQGLNARAAGREYACHEGRGVAQRASLGAEMVARHWRPKF